MIPSISNINNTSSVSFPRVWLCRRGRLKTDLLTRVLVSPSWHGRDKPPAHAVPIQATSSQLPQGRWQRGGGGYCDKLPYKSPELTYSRGAFLRLSSPFISNGRSCFPAFCLLIFFFSSWSDPWGRDAKQGCHHFLSSLSKFYSDFLWLQASALIHTPAYLIIWLITSVHPLLLLLSHWPSSTCTLLQAFARQVTQTVRQRRTASSPLVTVIFVLRNRSACSCSIYAHLYLWMHLRLILFLSRVVRFSVLRYLF